MEFDLLKNLFSKNKKLTSKEQILDELNKFLTKNKIDLNNINFEKIFENIKKFSKNEVDELENIFDLFEFEKNTNKKDIFLQLKNWIKLYFKVKLDDLKIKSDELTDEIIELYEKEGISINKTMKYSLKEWYKEKFYEKEKIFNLNEFRNKLNSLNNEELLLIYFVIIYAKDPYYFLTNQT